MTPVCLWLLRLQGELELEEGEGGLSLEPEALMLRDLMAEVTDELKGLLEQGDEGEGEGEAGDLASAADRVRARLLHSV